MEVHDIYRKHEKLTINFEPIIKEDIMNKAYLDQKYFKVNGHFSLLGKSYNEFKLQYNKQSVEKILIQRAVQTTIQILNDRGLIDNFQYADAVLIDFLFVTRRRGDLEEIKYVIQ